MKLLQTPGGGTKTIYDIGDEVTYRNPFAPKYIANGTDRKTGANLIVSDFLADGNKFIVQDVIPANIHKMHDQYRYIVSANRDGQNIELILNEIYLRG
jgi:hypothetical protein